ncbi:MAG TPA: VOC family protein [Longimicrobiaceae bacterium]
MATAEAGGITGIGQIALRATDLPLTAAFYRDMLGLPAVMEIPNAVFFDCGGVRIMLSVPESAEFEHPASIVYYRVADLQGSYRSLRDRGVRFRTEPHLIARLPDHELWMAFLEDPSGNVLALMSEVKE